MCQVKSISNWLNAISVVANLEQAKRIGGFDFVESIDLVNVFSRPLPKMSNLDSSGSLGSLEKRASIYARDYGASIGQLSQINVPAAHEAGYFGQGVRILVLDSGFKRTHKAFAKFKVIDTYDFVRNETEVGPKPGEDPSQVNHGTMVLSALAAQDEGSV